MTPLDQADLILARKMLNKQGLATRLAGLVGVPLDGVLAALPRPWAETVQLSTQSSLERALRVAVRTLGDAEPQPSRNRLHLGLSALSGALGGSVGLTALPVELPVSTLLMMRSIAAIARQEGESIHSPEAAVACMEVFALGNPGLHNDPTGQNYFAARAALGQVVNDAVQHLSKHGLTSRGAPALVRLISAVAARFGVVVSQKVALQALPVLGGVGGAAVNAVFMEYYQSMARGHFILRRLQRTYGAARVRHMYEALGETPAAAGMVEPAGRVMYSLAGPEQKEAEATSSEPQPEPTSPSVRGDSSADSGPKGVVGCEST